MSEKLFGSDGIATLAGLRSWTETMKAGHDYEPPHVIVVVEEFLTTFRVEKGTKKGMGKGMEDIEVTPGW